MRTAGSYWSPAVALGLGGTIELRAGRASRISSPSTDKRVFCLAAVPSRGKGRFRRTTVTTFRAQITLINALESKRTIAVRQAHLISASFTERGCETSIAHGQKANWHWWDGTKPRLVCVLLEGLGCEWTGCISFANDAEIVLRSRDARTNIPTFLNVSIVSKGDFKTVIFREKKASEPAPFRLVNRSVQTIYFRQPGCADAEVLLPYHSCSYAFDEPTLPQSLRIEAVLRAKERATNNKLAIDVVGIAKQLWSYPWFSSATGASGVQIPKMVSASSWDVCIRRRRSRVDFIPSESPRRCFGGWTHPRASLR